MTFRSRFGELVLSPPGSDSFGYCSPGVALACPGDGKLGLNMGGGYRVLGISMEPLRYREEMTDRLQLWVSTPAGLVT